MMPRGERTLQITPLFSRMSAAAAQRLGASTNDGQCHCRASAIRAGRRIQYMLSVHVVSTWCTHVHGGVGVEGTCELVLFGGEVVADTNKLPDGWKPRTARH